MSAAAPLLDVADLSTYFFTRGGVVKAVDGVSFRIGAGEVLGLVGESGSGKTVTGFSLLGLIEPPGRIVGGSIRFEGQELVGVGAKHLRGIRGRRLAMVFQDPTMTLNPVLTIVQQMGLAMRAHERCSDGALRARCIEVLTAVGMPDPARRLEAYPHEFSGGMRQRVAIAIALLHRPPLIIADEPTTALDVSIQAQILAEMKELVRELGTSLLWISHDLAVVSSLADRIAVMYAGRIVETGPTGDVLRDPRHPYTRGLLDSLPAVAKPGKPLAPIPGMMPSLLNLPAGCAFAPRCGRADGACDVLPGLASVGDAAGGTGRTARCHHPLAAPDAMTVPLS
ncbi:MAG: ABC transporter ATP-binding protein [Lautropia sp.]